MLQAGWEGLRTRIHLERKLVGWWPAAVSAAVLSAFLAISASRGPAAPPDDFYLRRAIETLAPLLFAVQVAFLLGPDNEPALELLSSYPRSMPRLFLERLLLVVCMHAAVALTGTVILFGVWRLEDPALALLRWLASGILLGGVAVFTTQLTRQGIFGTLLVTLLWAASLYGGDEILKAWDWFWPFHIYLQPEKLGMQTYLLNRLGLAAGGVLLTLLALKFLGDGDRLLGDR
jgi:hypothetical protein